MPDLAWLGSLLPAELSPPVAAGLISLSFATSMLSAAAGLGGGVVLLTVMVSVLPPVIVLPVHGVVQLGSNAGRALLLRQFAHRTILVWFSAGALVGVVAAAHTFVVLPVSALQTIIALFVLYAAWGPKLRSHSIPTRAYALVGAATTFITMFVGATGALVAAFFSPERLGRRQLVATTAACMTVQHTLKVLAFGFIGFSFARWAPFMAAMIGVGFLGTMTGRRVLGRLPEKVFALVFRGVITVLALRLLYLALAG